MITLMSCQNEKGTLWGNCGETVDGTICTEITDESTIQDSRPDSFFQCDDIPDELPEPEYILSSCLIADDIVTLDINLRSCTSLNLESPCVNNRKVIRKSDNQEIVLDKTLWETFQTDKDSLVCDKVENSDGEVCPQMLVMSSCF